MSSLHILGSEDSSSNLDLPNETAIPTSLGDIRGHRRRRTQLAAGRRKTSKSTFNRPNSPPQTLVGLKTEAKSPLLSRPRLNCQPLCPPSNYISFPPFLPSSKRIFSPKKCCCKVKSAICTVMTKVVVTLGNSISGVGRFYMDSTKKWDGECKSVDTSAPQLDAASSSPMHTTADSDQGTAKRTNAQEAAKRQRKWWMKWTWRRPWKGEIMDMAEKDADRERERYSEFPLCDTYSCPWPMTRVDEGNKYTLQPPVNEELQAQLCRRASEHMGQESRFARRGMQLERGYSWALPGGREEEEDLGTPWSGLETLFENEETLSGDESGEGLESSSGELACAI